MRVCVKCKCVFSPWPIHDPVACLSSVYFNLSSLLSLSSHMPGLILHCRLSLWIDLLESARPLPLPLFTSAPTCFSLIFFTRFPTALTLLLVLSLSPLNRFFFLLFLLLFSCIYISVFPLLPLSLCVLSLIRCFWLRFILHFSPPLSGWLLDASSSRRQAAS